MKYTILGFSQKAACELGLDVTDIVLYLDGLLILRTLAKCAQF